MPRAVCVLSLSATIIFPLREENLEALLQAFDSTLLW